jgi:hypothetical protein
MNKPNALAQLLDELKCAVDDTSVIAVEQSWVEVHLGSGDPLRLNRKEAELLLHSTNTVEMLFQALEEPVNAVITTHDIVLEDDVLECLERLFRVVDDD